MLKEEKSDLLQKEEKKYQKPTMVSLGKLVEETKSGAGGGNPDEGQPSTFSLGG